MVFWRRDDPGGRGRTAPARSGDYHPEMPVPHRIDDHTAEALLTGRPVPPALEPLTRVVAAYRQAADRPVPPSAELAAWMAAGGLITRTAAPEPSAVGESRGRPAAAGRRRRRRRMPALEVLAGVAAKLGGMSVAAKALAGVAVATAGVGTAGLAGALPDPAQEQFDTVVESVLPGEAAPTGSGESGDPAGPAEPGEFGDRVSEDAQDGGVDGGQISEEARQLGEQYRPSELPTAAPEPPADPGPPSERPVPVPDPTTPPAPPAEDHRPIPPPGR